MIQFYAPDIESTGCLPESDSAHCSRVLRMKAGEEVTVVDGKGKRFLCSILESHPKHTLLEIISSEEVPNHWRNEIILAVAPTKHTDRMEWLIEKVVEIGVDRVVLLRCRRSERKAIRIDRLEKVAVAAMKQSLKTVVPIVEEISDFGKFVKESRVGAQKFFGYCDSAFPRKDFSQVYSSGSPVVVMIGPEGDFAPEEVSLAIDNGFVPVTFGQSRLRTETAALYGVAAIHVLNQLGNKG